MQLMKGKIIPDYYVLCTGGLVLDKNYQVIYAQEIPFELVKEVCQKYENETIIGPHCLDEKYLYFKYVQNDAPSYIKQFDSIDEFKNRKIYSFSLIESIRAKEITKEINENYPSLHAFQNVNAIDVVKRGCSKGNGILEITKLISDETAGIGDSYNDLEMFKVVNQSLLLLRHLLKIFNNKRGIRFISKNGYRYIEQRIKMAHIMPSIYVEKIDYSL